MKNQPFWESRICDTSQRGSIFALIYGKLAVSWYPKRRSVDKHKKKWNFFVDQEMCGISLPINSHAILIKKTSPHGKSTSIYKKRSKSFIKNEKSWSNLKLASEKFWDRKISEIFIDICMKMKNFEIKNFENFRSQTFRKFSLTFAWKMKNCEIENFRKLLF